MTEQEQYEIADLTEKMRLHMLAEMLANGEKGPRRGWLQSRPMALVLEIYYHVGKLQDALKGVTP